MQGCSSLFNTFCYWKPNDPCTYPDCTPSIFPTHQQNPCTIASLHEWWREQLLAKNSQRITTLQYQVSQKIDLFWHILPSLNAQQILLHFSFLIERDTDRNVGKIAQFPIFASIKVEKDTDCLTFAFQQSFSIESLRKFLGVLRLGFIVVFFTLFVNFWVTKLELYTCADTKQNNPT